MKKYVCSICGFVYDEAKGIPESRIAAGTKWESLPSDWKCPLCGAPKVAFKAEKTEEAAVAEPVEAVSQNSEELREMSFGEMSALCSNLARGCEKQYLAKESELFTQLADYYKGKTSAVEQNDFSGLLKAVEKDLAVAYPAANAAADQAKDRGAKRVLVWNEKVTTMLNSLLAQYAEQGDSMLEGTNVFVCDICGFIFVGNEPPEICPVCKVPKMKFIMVRR